jgi:hypothetical protein
VVLVERADRHQQDAGAQHQHRVDLEIEQRGLERDLFHAMLELELGDEADARTERGEQEEVEAPELHREAFAHTVLDEVVGVAFRVPSDRGLPGTDDEWPAVDASLNAGRVVGCTIRRSAQRVGATRIDLRRGRRGGEWGCQRTKHAQDQEKARARRGKRHQGALLEPMWM